jgi:hypothetical protein
MTYQQFKFELKRAGISVKGFAELLAMNPTSITNYRQKHEVPRHLAIIAVMLAELSVRGVDAGAIAHVLKKK